MTTIKFALLLSSIVLLGSCAENPATGARQFNMMSEDQEYKLGDQEIEGAVKQSGGVYQGHAALKTYYQGLAAKIAKASERGEREFNFYLLDDPMVNAFALPGHVAFSRGLLPYLQNEAQLAEIIGHEVGHVAAKHTAQTVSRGFLASLGVMVTQIAVAATTENAQLANLGGQLAGVGANAVMASYSRGQEFEADTLGLRYMSAVGYNPRDAAGAFSALQRSGELVNTLRRDAGYTDQMTGFHRVFASHPDEVQRIEQIINQTKTTATTASPNEAQYMQAINGVDFGMKESEIVVKGQTLYGPSARAKITFPKGFFVNGYVDGVPYAFDPDRKIRVDVQSVKIAAGASPAEVLQELTGSASARKGEVNGMSSAQTIVSKDGRVLYLYVLKDEASKTDDSGNPQAKRDFFLVSFSAPQAVGKTFEAEADGVVQTLKRTTAAEVKGLQGPVIRTRAVRSGETVATLAAQQPFGRYNELFFRAFNGLDGNAQPKVGSWVKWVE